MIFHTLAALSALPLAFAHFNLKYPATRGFTEDNEASAPCGGYNSAASSRTSYPTSGAPIQLYLGHPQTNVAVYLSVGNGTGNTFPILYRRQFTVEGLGDFCIGANSVPSGLNISDGTQATLQVITAASDGPLYQCADITFTNTALSQSDYNTNCKNNTGIRISQDNISGNPNGTATTSGSASASKSGSAATASATKGAASHAKSASWAMGAIGLVGLAVL